MHDLYQGKEKKMKGKYSCPDCGENDWTPHLEVDGPPYDECNNCGYKFTADDVPHICTGPPHSGMKLDRRKLASCRKKKCEFIDVIVEEGKL